MIYQANVIYDKIMENGAVKRVNEPYLAEALSVVECEARVTENVAQSVSGDFSIPAIKRTTIAEIFPGSGWYWLVKVSFVTIDERTATEKRSTVRYIAQAETFDEAVEVFRKGMAGTMADWEIDSITRTRIADVFFRS